MSVTITRDDNRSHVATISIDFDELNLLTPERARQIQDAIGDLPDEVAVVVIRAPSSTDADTVPGLTAGLHIDYAKECSPHEGWDLSQQMYEMMQAVRDRNSVTVCGCGDYALGAGFELAISCDFRVATPEAVLGLPEVNVGLPTIMMGGLLIRLVGLQTAKDLIYTGETISGDRALRLGIVNETAPPDTYDEVLNGIVDELAEKSPVVMKWQKYVFRHWRSIGLEHGMKHSIGAISRCFGTHDQQEAMAAFLEDRPPEFTGV